MKRFSLFLSLVLSAAVLSGCGAGTEVRDISGELDSAFCCDMNMVYENTEFEGKITRYEAGRWEAEFTSPDTVSGVKLSFSGKDVTASYKGLAFTVPKSALPVRSLLLNLIDTVDKAAAEQQTECASEDGCLVIEGDADQGRYKLCLDQKNCDLVSFSMDNLKMKMNFENTSEIKEPDQNTDDNAQESTETYVQSDIQDKSEK